MSPVNGQREYIKQRVLTASPVELVQILYETGIQALDRAIDAQNSGDVIERGRAVSKAIEVLSELQASLRHDVSEQYSRTLSGLYSYMRTQLMRAHAEQSLSVLQEVARLFNTLLEGWSGAMARLDASQAEDSEVAGERVAMLSVSDPYSGDSGYLAGDCRSWQL